MRIINGQQCALAWTLGYFVLVSPIMMVLQYPLIYSLFHSIFGVAVAVAILFAGDKE